MLKNSQIPIWVNIFMLVLLVFMTIQIYWFYFNHQVLLDAGITINGDPDLNVMYSTAGRLVAMVAVTVFVMIAQNPHQYIVVLLLAIFREGQETFIDPLYPYANAPNSPLGDFGIHVVIVALEVAAFIVVLSRIKQKENASWKTG